MSHAKNDTFIESVNEAREEEGLPQVTLSQAVEEMGDPYCEVVRESMDAVLQEQIMRSYEYGY